VGVDKYEQYERKTFDFRINQAAQEQWGSDFCP
jgi:hypothetical protein